MKIPELREKIQARPRGVVRQIFDRILTTTYATKVEVTELQEELEKAIDTQIGLLTKMVLELQQMKMHLASMSDETTKPGDGED